MTAPSRPQRDRSIPPPEAWYGIRCLTGRERAAAAELVALGFEVFAPTYRTRTWPRKRRRSVLVERPLCPGYVFAFVAPLRWPDIAANHSVIGWITDDRGPLPVGRPELLRRFENSTSAGAYDDTTVEGRLKPGDELEVLFGPMAGWRVAFKAIKGHVIEGELPMLGTTRRVTIRAEDIHMARG